nr:hypothetical protein BaRGS_013416 [Batillaria attramentaria]
MCYLAGWTRNRAEPVKFETQDIDTSLCTHLVFNYAELDPSGIHIVPHGNTDPAMYLELTGLKQQAPELKVLLNVGGWAMRSEEFSALVSSESNMQTFASGAIEFLRKYNFDGLVIDWEYPETRGSQAGDKHRFTRLLQVVAVPPEFVVKAGVDGPDFTAELLEDYLINWIVNTSIPPEKLDLGISLYGASYNLTDPTNTDPGAPITGVGAQGELAQKQGFLAYFEVDYVMEHGLGGIMISTIDLDDFNGLCGDEKFPMLKAAARQFGTLIGLSLVIYATIYFVVVVVENRNYRTVCYVEGWTHWRDEPNKFETSDIDSNLCTHVVWNHGELNSTLNIVVHDNGDEDIYRSLTGLKSDAPELKVLLDIGGWPVGSEEFTQAFADEAVAYLRRFNFDGTRCV